MGACIDECWLMPPSKNEASSVTVQDQGQQMNYSSGIDWWPYNPGSSPYWYPIECGHLFRTPRLKQCINLILSRSRFQVYATMPGYTCSLTLHSKLLLVNRPRDAQKADKSQNQALNSSQEAHSNRDIQWETIRHFLSSSLLTDSNTRFALDLYQAICSSHEENMIFSPLGARLILGMVQMGAKGKAHNQIRKALRLQEDSIGEEFSALKSFLSAILPKRQEFTFNLANALYLQEGFLVKEQYLHSNKAFLQSSIKLVDFQDAKSCAEAISTWVENKTDGKIKNMFSMEDFGPLTRLVLVNALYFKGDWKQKFREEETQPMDFTIKDGSLVKVPMMKMQLRTKLGSFNHSQMNYQVVELPYEGNEFSLILLLPAEDVAIEEVEKIISVDEIQGWLSAMQEEHVEISLPRFQIEQKLDFKEIFKTLNITEIFSGGCDLSGITDSADLYVSQITQKIAFMIKEDGSEAAASTGGQVPAIMSLTANHFVANRPFLFILKNNPTESILFMGRVTNPEAQKMRGRDMDSL
ncbi:serpin I2 [Macrotis lagotis]|uniref:serpin I2 n=1 Tax=Macrotis lagotis TaxID=92651 RepID=UPI003D69A6E5